MKNYINYCTEEQTKRAYKLGAPIEHVIINTSSATEPFNRTKMEWENEGYVLHITFNNDATGLYKYPTTNELIGWLREEKKINISIRNLGNSYRYSVSTFINGMDVSIYFEDKYMGYKQAELEAIDAALNYLEK